MMTTIWTGLQAFGLLKSAGIAAVLISVLLGGYELWHHKVYQSGIDDAVAGIAREDARLINRATAARAKLKECQSLDRDWDQSTGRCK